jgi:PAP2 superfamily
MKKGSSLLLLICLAINANVYSNSIKIITKNKVPKKNSIVSKNNDVANYSNTVPNCWIKQFALIERWIAGMRPTVSARALSYIHLAAYETALPGMPNFISNQSKMEGLQIPKFTGNIKNYNWNIALNACYAKMDSAFLIGASLEHKATIAQLRDSLNKIYKTTVSQNVFDNSVAWGLSVANAVFEYSKTDEEGNMQRMKPYPKDYTIQTGAGLWIGETFGGYVPFTPSWGSVRTFTTFGNDLVSPPPPIYSKDTNSIYYKDQKEVYNNWKNMDYEKRWRAEFWSDDIVNLTFGPSMRIFVIASQMVAKENLNLEKTLHLYCKLGIGLNDATTACWKSKYIYNTERPWQFIKENIDTNFRSIMGECVQQAGKNPPFPGYPSGHSSCAGVGQIILAQFFGENYLFTDYSHLGRKDFNSTPRTFTTMTAMADDNAYSRIPMGAHTRFDCDEGLRLGRLVGKNVVQYNLENNK